MSNEQINHIEKKKYIVRIPKSCYFFVSDLENMLLIKLDIGKSIESFVNSRNEFVFREKRHVRNCLDNHHYHHHHHHCYFYCCCCCCRCWLDWIWHFRVLFRFVEQIQLAILMEIIVVVLFLVLPKSIRETKREIDRDNGHNVNESGRAIVRSFVRLFSYWAEKRGSEKEDRERKIYPYMYRYFIVCITSVGGINFVWHWDTGNK